MAADAKTEKSENPGTQAADDARRACGANAPAAIRLEPSSAPHDLLEPQGQELIARYKQNYGMSDTAHVTEDMILEHWSLEKNLRRELLASTPENRWAVFEQAYDTLYNRLPWLNELQDSGNARTAEWFRFWEQLIGKPPQSVYEVGSGRGQLISHLAKQGFHCKATEITQERGKKWVSEISTLTWGASDGVHLDRFEPPATYDVMISDQVIEHIHPDDVAEHFRSSCVILKDSGRYIFSTPHCFHGPADVTRVFRHDKPMGMHLKEYTHGELKQLVLDAGFRRVFAVLRLPHSLRRLTRMGPVSSRAYLRYLTLLESALSPLSPRQMRRAARILKAFLLSGNIVIVAQK